MNRYYSTQRPVDMGTYPKPAGNEIKHIENFNNRIYCPEIKRAAWGFIDYAEELTDRDARNYELVKA